MPGSMSVGFFVPGIPRPAGSKRYLGRRKTGTAIITDDSGESGKTWRRKLKLFAVAKYREKPVTGPVGLRCCFEMPRPKSHFGTGRNAKKLKPAAQPRLSFVRLKAAGYVIWLTVIGQLVSTSAVASIEPRFLTVYPAPCYHTRLHRLKPVTRAIQPVYAGR